MVELFISLLGWLPVKLLLICAAVIALFFFFVLLHFIKFILDLLPFI